MLQIFDPLDRPRDDQEQQPEQPESGRVTWWRVRLDNLKQDVKQRWADRKARTAPRVLNHDQKTRRFINRISVVAVTAPLVFLGVMMFINRPPAEQSSEVVKTGQPTPVSIEAKTDPTPQPEPTPPAAEVKETAVVIPPEVKAEPKQKKVSAEAPDCSPRPYMVRPNLNTLETIANKFRRHHADIGEFAFQISQTSEGLDRVLIDTPLKVGTQLMIPTCSVPVFVPQGPQLADVMPDSTDDALNGLLIATNQNLAQLLVPAPIDPSTDQQVLADATPTVTASDSDATQVASAPVAQTQSVSFFATASTFGSCSASSSNVSSTDATTASLFTGGLFNASRALGFSQ